SNIFQPVKSFPLKRGIQPSSFLSWAWVRGVKPAMASAPIRIAPSVQRSGTIFATPGRATDAARGRLFRDATGVRGARPVSGWLCPLQPFHLDSRKITQTV